MYNSDVIPKVEDCKQGNCQTHFPQFSILTKRELFKILRKVVHDYEVDKESYFRRSYKNSEALVEVYRRALKLEFLKACELIYQTEDSYVRYDMYISKRRDRVLVHNQCCR